MSERDKADAEIQRRLAAYDKLLAALENILSFLEDGTPATERSDEENRCIETARAALSAAGIKG